MIVLTALTCLAANVYFEARGQSIEGQIAVAQVTLNRAEQNESRVCQEVFRKHQFSWTDRVKRNSNSISEHYIRDWQSWQRSIEIANAVLNGQADDVANGATHFHNRSVHWHYRDLKFVKQIGDHKFYIKI